MSVENKDTDERIAEFIQSGRPEVFGVLVDRYEAKLKRYGERFLSRQEDIEDMVQEIFMKAYENIKSFDTSRRFSPWIYRIAHNTFVNKLRVGSRERLSFIDLDTLVSHPSQEERSEKEREEEAAHMRTMLDKALNLIEPKYREVLTLHYMEDFAYKEISEILSVPTSTVGVRIMRGREALKKAFMGIQN